MTWPTEDAKRRHLVRHPWRAYAVCVILSDMSDRLLAAARRFRRAEKAYEQAREDLAMAIVEAALDENVRQVKIVEATGYTREHIRRIVDEARRKRMQAAQS
jgi:hypothetical protein